MKTETKTEEVTLQGSTRKILPEILFSVVINRDSYSRYVEQSLFVATEMIINQIVSDMWAVLIKAIEKDEKTMNVLQVGIQEKLNALKDFQKNLFNRKDDKQCH